MFDLTLTIWRLLLWFSIYDYRLERAERVYFYLCLAIRRWGALAIEFSRLREEDWVSVTIHIPGILHLDNFMRRDECGANGWHVIRPMWMIILFGRRIDHGPDQEPTFIK